LPLGGDPCGLDPCRGIPERRHERGSLWRPALGGPDPGSRLPRRESDSAVAAFPDLEERLVRRRRTGRSVLDEVFRSGMRTCNDLLASEREMTLVAGYRFACSQRGLRNMRLVPDPCPLRRASWLEGSALVICDVSRQERDTSGYLAPCTILTRKGERAAAAGVRARGGSGIESFILRHFFDEKHRGALRTSSPSARTSRIYRAPKGFKVEPPIGPVRSHLESAGIRVEVSWGEPGSGR